MKEFYRERKKMKIVYYREKKKTKIMLQLQIHFEIWKYRLIYLTLLRVRGRLEMRHDFWKVSAKSVHQWPIHMISTLRSFQNKDKMTLREGGGTMHAGRKWETTRCKWQAYDTVYLFFWYNRGSELQLFVVVYHNAFRDWTLSYI